MFGMFNNGGQMPMTSQMPMNGQMRAYGQQGQLMGHPQMGQMPPQAQPMGQQPQMMPPQAMQPQGTPPMGPPHAPWQTGIGQQGMGNGPGWLNGMFKPPHERNMGQQDMQGGNMRQNDPRGFQSWAAGMPGNAIIPQNKLMKWI